MHVDVEQVQRLLHGELPPPQEAAVREHLAACPECREQVTQAERREADVHALLRALDHEPPQVDAGTVAVKAVRWSRRPARWAAGIVVGLGLAGAAYAAPGSPLPAWVKTAAQWVIGTDPAPPQAPEASVAGIAVVPGESLVVLFTTAQADGLLQVSLTDGGEVVVRAPSGAATFTSDGDRLVIDNRGTAAAFEIQIPRLARWVEIRVAGAPVFLKEGSRVSSRCHKLPCRLLPP